MSQSKWFTICYTDSWMAGSHRQTLPYWRFVRTRNISKWLEVNDILPFVIFEGKVKEYVG